MSESGQDRQGTTGALGRAAMVALFAGALGSVAATLYAGRHNHFVLLTAMFVVWVLAPFAGMFWVQSAARRMATPIRNGVSVAVVLVSVCSAVVYVLVAWRPPFRQAAFPFLALPVISWLVVGLDYLVAAFRSRK
jgi:FtsH-binding integral membrane protein